MVPASLGLGAVSLSLPAIIHRGGVAQVLPVSLSPSERRALDASAEIWKQHISNLDVAKAAVAGPVS